jgi:hypothetical protein
VVQGGQDDVDNLVHLHKACHKQEHSKTKFSRLKWGMSRMSWKLSCPVLRGGESGDARTLPDIGSASSTFPNRR